MWKRLASLFALALIVALLPAASAPAQVVGNDVLYTTDADFDLGTSVSVNHDFPFNDQLQLDSPTEPFPFINVAASGRGTVVRVNTDTGAVVGEYRTAPEGRGLNPSRTTVDLFGNVWTANREEVGEIDGTPSGSAVKIGLIVGGMRVDETGVPNPSGGYLAPPFGYSTCIDRDADGLIHTSAGLFDALDWPDVTDGVGGADGLVEDAVDECILIYQRLPDAEQARHVSVDADNNVWVGGFPFELRHFYKLDGTTGAFLDSFDARDIGCGGYGGLIDGNGVLWSIGWGTEEGALLRYDPATREGSCVNIYGGYGLGIDTNGYVWGSIWENGISKVSPDGILEPGFPKWTVPPSAAIAWSSGAHRAMTIPLAVPGSVNAADVADPDVSFVVSPGDDWVQSQGPWTAGAAISLTIEDGSGVVYSDSQVADGAGNFNFNLGGVFDLERGHLVTVSDGATKTHTVMNLFVDGVDLSADTVFGRADAGATVHVWVNGVDGMDVTADGSGNWTADFNAVADITGASSGGAQQTDDDGDATHVGWGFSFVVSPGDDWVQSQGPWTAGAAISLTIEDGSGVVYSDSQVADGAGNFNFNLGGVFDLERGHLVTVSDGATKTHTVMNLFVDGVDLSAETVFGRADAGTTLLVWVDGVDGIEVTADGSGNWLADFSAVADITEASTGSAQQTDADGDSTHVGWQLPSFQVSPGDDWVQSQSAWTPGATISLTIEDGSGVVYSDTQTADSSGYFNFNLWEVFDLERGHLVTVSDGATTKTHTVMNLFVDGVDLSAETVFGRADAGATVQVWVHDNGNVNTTADSSGNWVANFSGMTDLTYASDGGSQVSDDDGDSTGVWWATPTFQVAPNEGRVESTGRWTPHATIALTIEDGSGVVYSDSQAADGSGNFQFDVWEAFDLLRSNLVTVSDGITTKTHIVTELSANVVDVAADTVSGVTTEGTEVHVWVDGNGEAYVTADGSGNWTADFSGQTDLTNTSQGGSQQVDEDGDATFDGWSSPTFQVQPDDDVIASWSGWRGLVPVSVTVEDASGTELYSGSALPDETYGEFRVDLRGILDVQRGHIVSVSDGTATKTHEVMNLFITDVDFASDEVFGTADAGTDVEVQVHSAEHAWRIVTTNGAGEWSVDFSILVGEGDGIADIDFGSGVSANQYDDDNDVTWVSWRVPTFRVDPENNNVDGGEWLRNTMVTIYVDDDGDLGNGTLWENTTDTEDWGNFGIGVDYDIVIGHYVTVTDGETTKIHVVTGVDVTNIDTAADTITGTAAPGADVYVSAGLFGDWSDRFVQADSGGNWVADFAVEQDGNPVFDITDQTFINVDEFDDDGDATTRSFGPEVRQNRGLAVTPIDNHVWVANSGTGTVTRLDNDGNVLAVVETGNSPTGVAVDAAGKVWVTNQGSDDTVRVDPAAGADGLGAVDLTVELGEGAGPYNYSDMTGAVVVGSTSPQGFWTVVQDSGEAGFEWGRVTWNTEPEASEPEGTEIVVEIRTSDSEAGLGGALFVPVVSGELLSSFGRYIEVRATLKASPGGESPVLSDIRVQPAIIEVDIDIKPGSYPNSINLKRSTGVVPMAVLGSDEFDVMTIDVTTLRFGRDLALPAHDLTRFSTYLDHLQDVNDDGFMDLVSHYAIRDIGFIRGDTEACLVGETLSGIPIHGCDSVRLIGKLK